MHILIGAAIGLIAGAIGAVIMAKLFRQPVTWKTVLAGAIGGAIGGAITAATLGAGGAVAATATRAATAYIVGGGAGNAGTRVLDNELEGRPIGDHLVTTTVVGAASGGVFYGAGRLLGPSIEQLLSKLPFKIPSFGPKAPPEPEPPEWQTYQWKSPPPAEPGDVVRVKIADLRTREHIIWGKARNVARDPSQGDMPEVSWVDWDGPEPFWALREGNHHTFIAAVDGQETVLAKVSFLSQKTSSQALYGSRDYVPFPKVGVWDESGGGYGDFMGPVSKFVGTNPFHAPPGPSGTPGVVQALGGH